MHRSDSGRGQRLIERSQDASPGPAEQPAEGFGDRPAIPQLSNAASRVDDRRLPGLLDDRGEVRPEICARHEQQPTLADLDGSLLPSGRTTPSSVHRTFGWRSARQCLVRASPACEIVPRCHAQGARGREPSPVPPGLSRRHAAESPAGHARFPDQPRRFEPPKSGSLGPGSMHRLNSSATWAGLVARICIQLLGDGRHASHGRRRQEVRHVTRSAEAPASKGAESSRPTSARTRCSHGP